MPEQHPQDQPGPKPQQDWHEVSAEEIEQTLSSAADLAHELAGDVGVAAGEPRFRDNSGLESIETALDVELKQLEHLVSRTKEELSEGPPRAKEAQSRTSSIPDFMSEFLADEPVKLVPEPRPSHAAVHAPEDSKWDKAATDESIERRGKGAETARAGLIGVGSLGHRESKKPNTAEKLKSGEQAACSPRTSLRSVLEKPAYKASEAAVRMLEIIDQPFAKLSSTGRRGLSVIAITAFGMCLLMFLLALIFS